MGESQQNVVTLAGHVYPLKLDNDNQAEAWRRWKQKLEIFIIANELENASNKRKVAILLNSVGDAGLEIFNSFNITESEEKFENVIKKFDDHFIPKKNITIERHKFLTRKQKYEENFQDFLTGLYKFSLTCEFGDLRDSLIKDTIVLGIRDNLTRERLLRAEDLDLKKTIKICKAAELAQKQVQEISVDIKKDLTPESILAINVKKKTQSHRECYKCGYKHWDPSHKCPAIGATCAKCKKKNHFAKVCKSRHIAAVEQDMELEDNQETLFIGSVEIDTTSEWIETFLINGNEIKIKLDTGAQVNCMSYNTFIELGLNPKSIL